MARIDFDPAGVVCTLEAALPEAEEASPGAAADLHAGAHKAARRQPAAAEAVA